MSENPAIHKRPSGDVDIDVPERVARDVAAGDAEVTPAAATDPENLDHPEELLGE